MRSRIDIAGQLPDAAGPRLLTLVALVVGAAVALGLTALILVFLITAGRR